MENGKPLWCNTVNFRCGGWPDQPHAGWHPPDRDLLL